MASSPDTKPERQTRSFTAPSDFYLKYVLGIVFGGVLLFLGVMMITNIRTWEIFSVWLPLSLFAVGFILLSSKTYSVWLGFLLLILGGLFWLHDISLASFPHLTRFIDWSFAIAGTTVIALSLYSLIRALVIKR